MGPGSEMEVRHAVPFVSHISHYQSVIELYAAGREPGGVGKIAGMNRLYCQRFDAPFHGIEPYTIEPAGVAGR